MCIFPVLMILYDSDLDEECSECLAIFTASYVVERDIDPAFGLREFEGGEGD